MAERLAVLQVARPAAGGIARHVSQLAAGLPQRGIDTLVAAPTGFRLEGDARLVPVPITARPSPLADVRAARIVARTARDFAFLHGHGLRGGWIAHLAAHIAGRPYLVTAHNLAPAAGALSRLLVGRTLRRSCAVVTVSRAVAQSLALFGFDAASACVIPNGVDLTPFDRPASRADVLRALGIPSGVEIVAAVGRLSPEKGFATLVDAAPGVFARYRDVCFVLAGEGAQRQALIERARAQDAEGRFLFAGRVEDLPGLLAATDIVAVPSLQEGQGIVALEAMAARRPVVASRVGGLPETVDDGITGLLVNPSEPAALCDAILRLLCDEPLRRRLGESGRRRVEEGFTLPAMLDHLAALYRSLAGGI